MSKKVVFAEKSTFYAANLDNLSRKNSSLAIFFVILHPIFNQVAFASRYFLTRGTCSTPFNKTRT